MNAKQKDFSQIMINSITLPLYKHFDLKIL